METRKDIKLHLGCGKRKIHGFVNVDINSDYNPDIIMDITQISKVFQNVDLIYACHVLEHFPRRAFRGHLKTHIDVLYDWYKSLRNNGTLRLSVPNFPAAIKFYDKTGLMAPLYSFFLGGQKDEWDIHYNIFDYDTLEQDLKTVGFTNVSLYDRWKTEHFYVDDYSAATLDPPFSRQAELISMNVEAIK